MRVYNSRLGEGLEGEEALCEEEGIWVGDDLINRMGGFGLLILDVKFMDMATNYKFIMIMK